MCQKERISQRVIIQYFDYRTPLMQLSFYKYKYLWGVRGKGQGSNLYEGASLTYTFRLN